MLNKVVNEDDLPKTPYDSSELYRKMREEWASLQNNPSTVDDQIRSQLEMLEQINNNAFNEVASGATNPNEIGKMMQVMMKK